MPFLVKNLQQEPVPELAQRAPLMILWRHFFRTRHVFFTSLFQQRPEETVQSGWGLHGGQAPAASFSAKPPLPAWHCSPSWCPALPGPANGRRRRHASLALLTFLLTYCCVCCGMHGQAATGHAVKTEPVPIRDSF